MENNYKKYMRRCLTLAKLSFGQVSPNPLVGAVVLDKDGKFAGEGRHEKYGFAHAEVNAIANAKKNGIDITGGTIIVNLEPCSHHGKTPPCADFIIENKLKRVVIGCFDPNPKVSGKGIKKLKAAGIEVIQGVLEKECKELNEIFIKNQTEKMPFVSIKTATTLDGKIATKTGSSKWITSEKSREVVQKLRNKYDAIMTGSGTVLADNPSLTCRKKNKKGRNPIRIIVDSELKTLKNSKELPKVFIDDGTRVIVAVSEREDVSFYKNWNIEFIPCPIVEETGKLDLNYLLKKLFENGIFSIMVEAGGKLNAALLKVNLVDKLYQFVAPKIVGDEAAQDFVEGFDIKDINDSLVLEIKNIRKYSPDFMIEAVVKNKLI